MMSYTVDTTTCRITIYNELPIKAKMYFTYNILFIFNDNLYS
jgi:hypothetical protein